MARGGNRGSWLCPDDARRERMLDMEMRLKPVRTVAMSSLMLALLIMGPWMGWWPALLCVGVGMIFLLADRALERFERPELALAGAWAFSQFAIAGAVWLTGGPDSPAISWLAIPVVTLASRFDLRGVVAGGTYTALLMLGVTVGHSPRTLTDSPQEIVAPLALLFAVAALTTALMRSDIAHRTESVIDGLTGMLNRRALATRVSELEAQARITGEPIGVVIGDIDHFKRVNDQHGHAVGDAVLVDVAYTLRKELRAFDLAYRLGGEEFLVLLPGASLDEAATIAERLRAAVAEGPAGGVHVTMSFGVASSSGGGFEYEAVLAAADTALYEAKGAGRDRVAVSGALPRALAA